MPPPHRQTPFFSPATARHVAPAMVAFAMLALGGLGGNALAQQSAVDPPPGAEQLDGWIEQLAADSYATRQLAQQRLLLFAAGSEAAETQARLRLRCDDAPPQDLELYLAKQRLLDQLTQAAQQTRLDRFLYDPSFDGSTLDGWDAFRRNAGNDLDTRLVFAGILKHQQESTMIPSTTASQWDPDQIDGDAMSAWCLLLSAECNRRISVADRSTLRLVAVLRCDGTGPMPEREFEQQVVTRLIASYLQRAPIDLRDQLVIGTRYHCDELVHSRCIEILDDPTQSPSRIVVALLAASKLDIDGDRVDRWIETYRQDTRVSHVWRSLTPPKSTHRTQIRDVAHALRLHRQGIDPRTHGFSGLVADPTLVYRPYSLGFASDEARQSSHAQ
ncbi:hypothetical protein NHH03_03635 [Stieleria sp. TO1_6]|uniref:hypothetical protein n=1 Tax=Stieleria tagensis TaxID=2956795 RepID=UPI00209B1577|nr:hypothetical protein [Stieleria tagensis]MCO8120817.1 hypothetical protein [Stieleria tagensis]